MTTVVIIINELGLGIDMCRGNLPNKSLLVLYKVLKNFALANQRPKVYFIFHNAQLRCEECFIE